MHRDVYIYIYMLSLTLIRNRTHKGCTGCSVSVQNPSVSGLWPANWREPMEWDLIWCQTEQLGWGGVCVCVWSWHVSVCVCVCVLDPELQLMVFVCIPGRACAQSQVWVRVAGRNGRTGPRGQALHSEKKEDLLMLWLIKRTAVTWPHIHMAYQRFTTSC